MIVVARLHRQRVGLADVEQLAIRIVFDHQEIVLGGDAQNLGVMALSGLSLVEAGYGLTLVARRYGVKRRAIPMYLLRKLVSAGQSGGSTVALGDDLYLVHESALHATTEDRYHFVDLADDGPLELVLEEGDDPDEPFRPATASSTPHLNLYASLAKGDTVAEIEAAPDEEASDPWDDDFSWRV